MEFRREYTFSKFGQENINYYTFWKSDSTTDAPSLRSFLGKVDIIISF